MAEDEELLVEEECESTEHAPQSWTGYSWSLTKKLGSGFMAGKSNIWNVARSYSYYLLTAIYYLGEKLTYAFGVTTPDWQYAIDIYEDLEQEDREEREAEERALRKQQEEIAKKLKEMEDAADSTVQSPILATIITS